MNHNVKLEGPDWDAFFGFVYERAMILFRRECGMARPWTDDPILQVGKFGNVWRKVDKGTEWELRLLDDKDKYEQAKSILTYRHNLIPWTTISILGNVEFAYADEHIQGPIFSDVIKIYEGMKVKPEDATREDWFNYALQHADDVNIGLHRFVNNCLLRTDDPRYVMAMIMDMFPLLGEFKSYEVFTSLTYCDWFPYDENSYPHVGHGSLEYLRRLTNDWYTRDDLMWLYLVELAPRVRRVLHKMDMPWPTRLGGLFTCRTFEDCICEWRKYDQVKHGLRDNKPWPDNLRRWDVE